MWDSIGSGLSFGLGVVLLAATVAKWRKPLSFELALTRLLPAALWRSGRLTSRTGRRLVVTIESGAGILLIANAVKAAPGVDIAAVALFATLLLVVALARRRKAPCGCMGSTAPATGNEVARGVLLLAAAVALLICDLTLGRTVVHDYRSAVGSGALFLFALRLTRLAPKRPMRSSRALAIHRETPASPPAASRVSRRVLLAAGTTFAAAIVLPWRSLSRPDRAEAKCCGLPGQGLALCFAQLDICALCCYGKDSFFETMPCLNCCDACFANCLTAYPGCAINSCGRCYNIGP